MYSVIQHRKRDVKPYTSYEIKQKKNCFPKRKSTVYDVIIIIEYDDTFERTRDVNVRRRRKRGKGVETVFNEMRQ